CGRLGGRLDVVHLEADVADPQLVGHRVRRPRDVVGVDEPGHFQPGSAGTGDVQADDLGAGLRDAAHGVDELPLDELPAGDLQAECLEEGHHRIDVRHRDPDVVE